MLPNTTVASPAFSISDVARGSDGIPPLSRCPVDLSPSSSSSASFLAFVGSDPGALRNFGETHCRYLSPGAVCGSFDLGWPLVHKSVRFGLEGEYAEASQH